MALTSQNKLVIGLAILLALVLAISLAVVFLWPTATAPVAPDSSISPFSSDATPPLDTGAAFDVRVFQQPQYQTLDQRLIQEGALPVQPPATTGKANIFL